jgi:hypothetical protein
MITIGDRQIETTIIDKVQRLPRNPVYDDLCSLGLVDLNQMANKYHTGQLSFETYLEFYLNIGYSVCGFAELSSFEHLAIKNPLWES